MEQAVALYRERFRPSEQLAEPYVMLGVNVFAADTEADARLAMSSVEQAFLALRRGRPVALQPPRADLALAPAERAMLEQALRCTVVGTPETVRAGLVAFADATGADELIVASHIYDHAARLRSCEIAATALDA